MNLVCSNITVLSYIIVEYEHFNKVSNIAVFTDSCIAAQTFVFLTAGTDSTATTISFVVYFLAKHPEIQKRAQAEVERCLSASSLSYQSIKDMTYLDQIIQGKLITCRTIISKLKTISFYVYCKRRMKKRINLNGSLRRWIAV